MPLNLLCRQVKRDDLVKNISILRYIEEKIFKIEDGIVMYNFVGHINKTTSPGDKMNATCFIGPCAER